jgi:XTP/dITP diphosphohydrolase
MKLPTLHIPPQAKLLVATHNAGKLREINQLLESDGLVAVSSAEIGLPEPEETGRTFEDNALLKAEAGAAFQNEYIVLSDDSGMEVDALDGAPGIYSARWGGKAKDFSVAMKRVYDEIALQDIDPNGQPARFVCVIALAKRGYKPLTFRGTVEGTLKFPPAGQKGFGYDPIFVPNGYSRTFAEMDEQVKRDISHRAHAFKLLHDYILMQHLNKPAS